jgi:subtilisin family serine protease
MSPSSKARKPVLTAVLAIVALLIVAVSAQASAFPAEGVILGADTPTAIDGSYIVTLNNSAAVKQKGVATSAQTLVGEHDGTLGRVFQRALRGFTTTMSEQQARRLAADPDVASVEQNQVMRVLDTQTNPPSWGLDRIDQKNLPLSKSYTYGTTASNVTAYIIDTGILTTHAEFGGRARSGTDIIDGDTNATDCHGHGTHVAGTVGGSTYGVAKGVKLVAVRVLDCTGAGSTAGVIAGVDWVTANAVKPAVANMSVGGGASAALDSAIAKSVGSGVTYAVAAGNNNADACGFSPSREPTAITVGATTETDARASFSDFGTCVDIFAPGTDITSSWFSSTTATNTISGTSMATPHVTGAAALYLAGNPAATPAQVTSALTGAATTGVVTGAGTGSPNRLLFTTIGDAGVPTPACASGTNGTDVAVPDVSTVESPVTISGCAGAASAATTVEVHIVHTFRGDLTIDLVAPDGTTYRLKDADNSDGAADVNTTYTVNASSEARNGTWKLRVNDGFAQDTGHIDSWTLTT